MEYLINLFKKLFTSTEKVPTVIKKERKKADKRKFTKGQLEHLLNVLENKKYGVTSYAKLVDYGNLKYGYDKVYVTYYNNINKYKKSLKG